VDSKVGNNVFVAVGTIVVVGIAVETEIGLGLLQAERTSKIKMARRIVRFIGFSFLQKPDMSSRKADDCGACPREGFALTLSLSRWERGLAKQRLR